MGEISTIFDCGRDPITNLENLIMSTSELISIAETFTARLEELKRIDEESQKRTKATLSRIRKLISETEEICEELTKLENEI